MAPLGLSPPTVTLRRSSMCRKCTVITHLLQCRQCVHFKRCGSPVSSPHNASCGQRNLAEDAAMGPALFSFIAEVNSVRTNLSPFTKGYRGLASRMQFDPIYARRTSLLRGALINQHSHSLENLTGLDLNKERSAHSALAMLSPRAETE